MRRKRGFSLVEVAVAIAVVAVASTITFMVVLRSNSLLLRSRTQVYAAYEAENVLKALNATNITNIYENAANLDDFKNIMQAIHEEPVDSEKIFCKQDGKKITIYYAADFSLSDENSYVYRLEITDDPSIVVYSNADKVFYRYGV